MNGLYFKFAAMARSGHHGVMYWITKNMNRKTVIRAFDGRNGGEQNYPNEAKNTGFNIDLIVTNFEDFKEDMFDHYDSLYKKYDNKKILILRHPLNLFASRKKLSEKIDILNPLDDIALNIYEYQLDLLEQNYFDHVIIYENFINDEKYRFKKGKEIGLNNNCRNLFNYISREGWGSSFSGVDKNLNEMQLLNRWKTLNEKDIDTILKRRKILSFVENNFPNNFKINNKYEKN